MADKVATAISDMSTTRNLNDIVKERVETEQQNRNYIVITRCLTIPCPGIYTDTISERLLILCKDPRHNHSRIDHQGGGQ